MDMQTLAPTSGYDALVNGLSLRDNLSSQELTLLLALPQRIDSFRRGQRIVEEESRLTECCLFVRGFGASVVQMTNGDQQITAIHIAGDLADLPNLMLKSLNQGMVALSECQIAFIPQQALLTLMDESPHLRRLLWLNMAVDWKIQRAWITSLGRRPSMGRLAHLVCEIYERLKAADLARGYAFEFPVVQVELADMLGLSAVHVNRSMQGLRATGWMTWTGRRIEILDYDRLKEFADFDPTYLNLINEPR